MAFAHSKDSKVYANEQHISTEIKGWTASWKRDYADTTALPDAGSRGTPGLMEGEFELEGHFNSAAVGSKPFYDEVSGAVGVDNGLNVTVQPAGDTIGMPAIFAQVDVKDFEVESKVSDAVQMSMSGDTNGGTDMGFVQKALASQAPGTTNQTSIDNLALTANGGSAMLHCTVVTGGGNAVVKVQHSTDDSVWVDLITFTTLTAVSSEFKEVAAGTTVNRYTRVTATCTTGTYTFTVAFARR